MLDKTIKIVYSDYNLNAKEGNLTIMSPGAIRNRVSEMAGRRRMNIKKLAEAAGISYQTAYSLYHDQTSRIDFATMAGLCKALEVEVGELFKYDIEEDSPVD